MEMQSPYLFVYGTLMRGFVNPFALRLRNHASFVREGSFPGRLYRVSWYPGAIYEPESSTKVHGEIYQLHDFPTLIQELDDYEDVKHTESEGLYLRRLVPVQSDGSGPLTCWTYLYNQSLTGSTFLIEGKFTA